ncbi:hypothetical protein LQF12_07200 [Ruania suaedae]|uniref:CHAT domain-containing protein n=1 Tax=Ruania suaedae TaxID=2897774 RepID=UPI001E31E2B7|nr:CHAT domain-containing protein [Ruania suaedae]UFU04357.1 hypothetical protein LQF12_07200 [Ruania suaedae]
MSEKQYRDKIATIKKQQAIEEKAMAKARSAAAKHRADGAKEVAKISARTSESMARTYRRNAESAESKAAREDTKVSAASNKLGNLAKDLANAQTNLDRETQAAARREEAKRKADARAADQADARRRQAEKNHAREVARLSRPTVRYVHELRTVPAPKVEQLRVLYLTANPEQNLRTDAEVRGVQDQVRRALHRDRITIDYRPAATAEDLIAGLNDLRPHVVHFSGHAGDAALLFDNGSVEAPEGRDVPYGLLARALGATDVPPVLVVLNGCDTLAGADVLLESTAVVVATASSISDLAASVFAAKFYAAIAAAQTIDAAVDQGSVSVDLAGLDEGWKLDVLTRTDVDTAQRVLVQVSSVD